MKTQIYQVNTFVGRLLKGNPAAVCPLDLWLPDETLQAIAAENNLSETAFVVQQHGTYELRWFTPTVEVDLCGHATLGAAYVVFGHLEPSRCDVVFQTRSGQLSAWRNNTLISLDFPADVPKPSEAPHALIAGLGIAPVEVWVSRDYMAVYASEHQVRSLNIDANLLAQLDRPGVIATALGGKSDFVSRYFAPKEGIIEDPVTGSAHCMLVPYWSNRLRRPTNLHAVQVSPRGGELWCDFRRDRVILSGRVVPYLEGVINVPEPAAHEIIAESPLAAMAAH